jgi:hypothetical protein
MVFLKLTNSFAPNALIAAHFDHRGPLFGSMRFSGSSGHQSPMA